MGAPGPLDIFSNVRGGGIDAVTTAYFFHEADLLAKSSAVIGKTADADRYAALADDIRRAYNARYWDGAMGWYRTMDDKGVAKAPPSRRTSCRSRSAWCPKAESEGRRHDRARCRGRGCAPASMARAICSRSSAITAMPTSPTASRRAPMSRAGAGG
jgi:hypothetical protein